MQIRQHVDPKSQMWPNTKYFCKSLIEANAVVWKTKQTTWTEKRSYFSYANYPQILCKIGQNFNWSLTALIEAKIASRIQLSIHVSTYAPQMHTFLCWQFPQRREWFLCMMSHTFSQPFSKLRTHVVAEVASFQNWIYSFRGQEVLF
jgi:hypothetical protein